MALTLHVGARSSGVDRLLTERWREGGGLLVARDEHALAQALDRGNRRRSRVGLPGRDVRDPLRPRARAGGAGRRRAARRPGAALCDHRGARPARGGPRRGAGAPDPRAARRPGDPRGVHGRGRGDRLRAAAHGRAGVRGGRGHPLAGRARVGDGRRGRRGRHRPGLHWSGSTTTRRSNGRSCARWRPETRSTPAWRTSAAGRVFAARRDRVAPVGDGCRPRRAPPRRGRRRAGSAGSSDRCSSRGRRPRRAAWSGWRRRAPTCATAWRPSGSSRRSGTGRRRTGSRS